MRALPVQHEGRAELPLMGMDDVRVLPRHPEVLQTRPAKPAPDSTETPARQTRMPTGFEARAGESPAPSQDDDHAGGVYQTGQTQPSYS